jgi:hypothetical protein
LFEVSWGVQPQHLAGVVRLVSRGLVQGLRQTFFGSEVGAFGFVWGAAAACAMKFFGSKMRRWGV